MPKAGDMLWRRQNMGTEAHSISLLLLMVSHPSTLVVRRQVPELARLHCGVAAFGSVFDTIRAKAVRFAV